MASESFRADELKQLREAVEREPSSADAHLKLGMALHRAGRPQPAEEALRRAVELDPNLYEGWVDLGGVLFSRWDFKGSVDANRRAVDCAPDKVQAHYNLGLSHLYLGEVDELVTCFRRVLELEPDNAGGYYHLACGLNAQGHHEAAQKNLLKSEELGFSPEPALVKAIREALDNAKGGDVPPLDPDRDPSST